MRFVVMNNLFCMTALKCRTQVSEGTMAVLDSIPRAPRCQGQFLGQILAPGAGSSGNGIQNSHKKNQTVQREGARQWTLAQILTPHTLNPTC